MDKGAKSQEKCLLKITVWLDNCANKGSMGPNNYEDKGSVLQDDCL
jgi:hypothetical protein